MALWQILTYYAEHLLKCRALWSLQQKLSICMSTNRKTIKAKTLDHINYVWERHPLVEEFIEPAAQILTDNSRAIRHKCEESQRPHPTWKRGFSSALIHPGYLFYLLSTSGFRDVQGLGLTDLLTDIYLNVFTSREYLWTSYLVQKIALPTFFLNFIARPLTLLTDIHSCKPWPLVNVHFFSLCIVCLNSWTTRDSNFQGLPDCYC